MQSTKLIMVDLPGDISLDEGNREEVKIEASNCSSVVAGDSSNIRTI